MLEDGVGGWCKKEMMCGGAQPHAFESRFKFHESGTVVSSLYHSTADHCFTSMRSISLLGFKQAPAVF